MTQGIHQLTASMVNQLNRVDVISNNLANANTVGFKEENLAEGTFNRYLKQQEKKDEVVLKESLIADGFNIEVINGSVSGSTSSGGLNLSLIHI